MRRAADLKAADDKRQLRTFGRDSIQHSDATSGRLGVIMFRWLFGDRSRQERAPEDESEWIAEEQPALVEPQQLPVAGEIVTDTASVAVFDIAAIGHRVEDECDWWADPDEELRELAARNLLIIAVESDGVHRVEVFDGRIENAQAFSLRVPSGTVFAGAGEEISGGGYEPDGSGSGYLISVEPGDYAVTVGWREGVLLIGMRLAEAFENET